MNAEPTGKDTAGLVLAVAEALARALARALPPVERLRLWDALHERAAAERHRAVCHTPTEYEP